MLGPENLIPYNKAKEHGTPDGCPCSFDVYNDRKILKYVRSPPKREPYLRERKENEKDVN